MSGGHYDYSFGPIRDLADRIYGDVTKYSERRKDEYSSDVYEPLPAATLADMRFVARLLEIASDAALDVEWMMRGDTGEETFGINVAAIKRRLLSLMVKGGSSDET